MENEKALIRIYFSETYNACKTSGADDDRLLFINKIDILMDALEQMDDVVNTFIRLAFKAKFHEELEAIKDLDKSLINRKMV